MLKGGSDAARLTSWVLSSLDYILNCSAAHPFTAAHVVQLLQLE